MSANAELEAADAPIEEEILTDHSYDGIREYDNPLPGWWSFLFWLFIVFAPIYFAFFHFGGEGRSIEDAYQREMARIFELQFAGMDDLLPDQETLLKYMEDPQGLAIGEMVYKANCQSCHGADGGGVVGPNLTDQNWKNVRNIEGIATVISEGANNGAMPAWKNRLGHPNFIVLTAAYVASLQSKPASNPAARGPEGDIVIKSWTGE